MITHVAENIVQAKGLNFLLDVNKASKKLENFRYIRKGEYKKYSLIPYVIIIQ